MSSSQFYVKRVRYSRNSPVVVSGVPRAIPPRSPFGDSERITTSGIHNRSPMIKTRYLQSACPTVISFLPRILFCRGGIYPNLHLLQCSTNPISSQVFYSNLSGYESKKEHFCPMHRLDNMYTLGARKHRPPPPGHGRCQEPTLRLA